MSSAPLLFRRPLTASGASKFVPGTSGFNQNIRLFRVLRFDFGDGMGMVPILVGTYGVDPQTGQPVPNTVPNLYASQFAVPMPGPTNILPAVSGLTYTLSKVIVAAFAPSPVVGEEVQLAIDNSGSPASIFGAQDFQWTVANQGSNLIFDYPVGFSLPSGNGLWVGGPGAGLSPVDVTVVYSAQ